MPKNSIDIEFIHLATEDQVCGVVRKFWGSEDYVVLKLQTGELKDDLRYEANPGGKTLCYHLYSGSIPFSAIREARMCGDSNQKK